MAGQLIPRRSANHDRSMDSLHPRPAGHGAAPAGAASGNRGAEKNQFLLLGTRRLLPIFVTQFLGAFNDNVFKQALLILFVFGGLVAAGGDSGITVHIAQGLFVLPFVLFSAIAGTLADKLEKSRLIRLVKLAEIGVAALAGVAVYTGNIAAMLGVLFLFGAQSTFFGPLKYAVLPQHLDRAELVGGNGMLQVGTLIAILIGTGVGGVIGASGEAPLLLVVCMLIAAGVGYLASRAIPTAASTHKGAVRFNPFTETAALIRIARERKAVFQSILGISWFWLLGSVTLAQIPTLVPDFLGGGPSVLTLILIGFTIAIGVGALLCEAMSGKRVEIGLVPIGAAGVSLFGVDLYFAIAAIDAGPERDALTFLSGAGTPRLLLDLAMMGVFSGLFAVPLQANIQARTPLDRRARVIAANNVMNAVFMVAGSAFAIAWLFLGGEAPSLLLALAVVNGCVAIYICRQVPEFTMRFLVWAISHTIYRVRQEGLAAIPDRGAAVIVCNHVSYVDAPLLAGAVRRPIRFVMHKDIHKIPVLNFIFRTSRTIPIASAREDPELVERAFNAIREGLAAGDLLCVFPEGKLTSDGEVADFRKGIERIVGETPVPVVPMALCGLWGSLFSREGRGAFKRRRGPLWRRVVVRAGPPVAPEQATAAALRERVLALLRP